MDFYPMFGKKLSPGKARDLVLSRGNHEDHFTRKSREALRFSREVARRNHLGLSADSEVIRIYLEVRDIPRSK